MNRAMSEIIRNQKPLTLPPDATVREACQRMDMRKIGAVLVTDERSHLLGIFTGRDAVRTLARGKDPVATRLKDIMTRKPATMPPDSTAIDALRLMRDGGFRHVPVVAEGIVVGIVSSADFCGLEKDRLDEENGIWEHMR